MEINTHELAWAAGFFDGEGSISLINRKTRKQKKSMTVQVGQTDLEILNRFRAAIGGLGRINGPYRTTQIALGTRKPFWTWAVTSFEKCQAVIVFLWPYLSHVKKQKAKEVLLAMKAS